MAGLLACVLVSTAGSQEHNKLSETEAQARYDLLFNGQDLKNWHAYRTDVVTDAWTVKANAPLGPRIENGNGNKLPILNNKKYKNFDVKIDVQTPAGGNSGIFTRYEETATDPGNARSGPELQVCGPSHSDCIGATKHYGSSYDMYGVKESIRDTWYNPPGSWNQLRIIVFDSNYVHYGNGKKLLEYKIGTAEYLKAYNESKYVSDGNNGRYYHIHTGGILLQHHGETGITFRNIKAKELAVHPFLKDFKQTGKWPEELSQEAVLWDTVASVGIAAAERSFPMEVSSGSDASGSAWVKVAAQHVDFTATGIDGRAVPFRKTTEGAYARFLISSPDRVPSIVIVRIRADGQSLMRIVTMQ
ncbi:MAG: DUF1080 domain-containing protein [Fibrobacterota bacterium]|nr:DUF1080 domain-containing protein [Fibrobacterota bacterium]